MKGLVIKNTGYWYTVLTDDGATIDCKVKGNFRLKGIRSTNPVTVGDRVILNGNGNDNGNPWITDIEDRKNYIIRKSSNLSKQCAKIAEKAKIEVRNVRGDIKDKLKKAVKEGLSEDLEKDAEGDLQKLHDKFIAKLDTLLEEKNKEIMTV